MAIYRRIKSTPVEIVITRDGVTRSISCTSLPVHPTSTQVRNAIRVAFGGGSIPDIFVHVNRDYSIALATEQEPVIWPEDQVE